MTHGPSVPLDGSGGALHLAQGGAAEEWRCVDLHDHCRRRAWMAEAQRLWESFENPHLAQYPGRLRAGNDGIVAVELRRDGRLVAYALFELSLRTVALRIGPVHLARFPLAQAEVVGGIVGDPHEFEASWPAVLRSLPENPYRTSVWLTSIPLSKTGADVLWDAGLRKRFHVFRFGRCQTHYATELPSDFQAFLAGLPARKRQDLRRTVRNLEREFGAGLRFQEFTNVEEVVPFLDQAVPISERTYQTKLLKVGIAEHRQERQRQYEALAAKGAWLAHILSCNGAPVAFLVGCRLGRVFYGLDTGYLPEWASRSVGRVAYAKLVERLYVRGSPPARFDFYYGDQDWKRGFANRLWREGSYALIPRWSRHVPLVFAAAVGERVTEAVAAEFARWGVKDRVRTFLNRRAF